jgi:hypothetical protein
LQAVEMLGEKFRAQAKNSARMVDLLAKLEATMALVARVMVLIEFVRDHWAWRRQPETHPSPCRRLRPAHGDGDGDGGA